MTPLDPAKSHTVKLGCIADDYTGASDIASILVASGLRTLQINGVPSARMLQEISDYDAIVIALKSRTAAKSQAISWSLQSLRWLQLAQCEKFYFKYCSTFDSTAEGNIGPVIDALLDELDQSSTVLCPALPINGRTVYHGYLFVDGKLLNESPLKDHPLTPMTDAFIPRLIEQQGRGNACSIGMDAIEAGTEALTLSLNQAALHHRYLVVDALSDTHLRTLAHSVKNFTLVTGGSGLALDIVCEFEAQGFIRHVEPKAEDFALPGPVLLLSGSCSQATQAQVSAYAANQPALFIDPFKLQSGEQSIESIMRWIAQHSEDNPLVYATAEPSFVASVHQSVGCENAQHLIESTMVEIARRSVGSGTRNIIVAGGETSGAVVSGLELTAFKIGPSIAPSVPVMRAVINGNALNLVLKSGNFGQENFFQQAVEAIRCY